MGNAPGGELAELLAQLRAIADDARREFGHLSAEQVNWQPGAGAWGVGQCFEHLIKTNESYFPTLERVSGGGWKGSLWERFSPLSGFWGEFLVKSVAPETKRKQKTSEKFQPSGSGVDPKIIEKFAESQERLAGMIEATGGLDLKRVSITSPFVRFVTYSLWDAYCGMVAHGRRHFAQARRVLEAEGFPRRGATEVEAGGVAGGD